MKKLMLLVPFLCMVSVASGEVSTRVCFADGNTPFLPVDSNLPIIEYPDIMVGTKLSIIISSDANESWIGDLFIAGENRDYGVLTTASCFDPVCEEAFFYPLEDILYQGFSFQTGKNPVAGDWFIVDYNATHIGDCKVGLYEWFSSVPTHELSFSHVRTRDFNGDTKVDFGDFAVLASYWGLTNCDELDWCDGVDLNTDRIVDFIDVMLFADYWLEKTDMRCHN